MTRGASPQPGGDSQELRPLLVLLLLAFVVLLVRTAWVCDDAYITFRVADNLLNGHGLRWNAAERVQAFTNPLWLFVMVPLYALTGDVYYTALALSVVLGAVVAWLLAFRIARTPLQGALALVLLILSRAFVDYSSSGLENPLSHALLAGLLLLHLRGGSDARTLERMALVAGLMALNRLDSVLLASPLLLARVIGMRRETVLRAAALAAGPALAWMAFSLFYYGFPFPNTAYGKLNTGIDAALLAQQGFHYLLDSLSRDPLTLTVVATALALQLASGRSASLAACLAVVLHVAYVVEVGGDFMSGRFLAAPFLVAVALVAASGLPFSRFTFGAAAVAALALALTGPDPNLATTAFFYSESSERRALLDDRGVTDERAHYFRYTGLLTARRTRAMPAHHRAEQGRTLRAQGVPLFHHGQIGMLGFFAGPGVHIYEGNGLADAFIARLPARPSWRPGHFVRNFPIGYEASLRRGRNRLADPELRELWNRLRLITRGDLLDPERVAAIWDSNFGPGRTLGRRYFAMNSRMQSAALADLQALVPEGTPWDAPDVLRFSAHGVEVALGRTFHPKRLELSLDGNDGYSLECRRLDVRIGAVELPARPAPGGGLSNREASFDDGTAGIGCDTLRVLPAFGDESYGLGHLRILQEAPFRLEAAQAGESAR